MFLKNKNISSKIKRSKVTDYVALIYNVLRSYPAIFMKSSSLYMEIWSFETIQCLNYHTQRQTRHDVTKEVKVNFLYSGLLDA